jgi:hypothetical protein
LKRKPVDPLVGSAQVEHTPQVDGHAWSTPLIAQRLVVSFLSTQVQNLAILVPLDVKSFNLSVLSTHVVGAATGAATGDPVGDAVTVTGDPVGDAVTVTGDVVGPKGAADGDGDGLMELVGTLVGASLGTALGSKLGKSLGLTLGVSLGT